MTPKKEKLLKTLIKSATTLLKEKKDRGDAREVFASLFEYTALAIENAVFPIIQQQVQSIVTGLEKMTDGLGDKSKSYEDQAHNLILQVFDPLKWKAPLVDAIFPPLAVGMARSVISQYALIGVDILGLSKETKTTTATDWVQNHYDNVTLMDDVVIGAGVAGMTLLTEIPQAVKNRIASHLKDSFGQVYWEEISKTTGGMAEKIIKDGLMSGWSIRKMAGQIAEVMGSTEYAKGRARNIAITESGGALNGARKGEMDVLMHDLPQLDMRPIWLSVLSRTTRLSHALLDMVPANENGMWYLGGMWIPYPGYFGLPPENRCNCMCTLFMQFGIKQDFAARLIRNYFKRMR
jgi:hypothetical protein